MKTIPTMTDPLGKYWQQPDPSEIEIDDDNAVMEKGAFDKLLEYSTSTPSGVYIGKMWKGQYKGGAWYLAWFSKGDDAKTYLNNNYRVILCVTDKKGDNA